MHIFFVFFRLNPLPNPCSLNLMAPMVHTWHSTTANRSHVSLHLCVKLVLFQRTARVEQSADFVLQIEPVVMRFPLQKRDQPLTIHLNTAIQSPRSSLARRRRGAQPKRCASPARAPKSHWIQNAKRDKLFSDSFLFREKNRTIHMGGSAHRWNWQRTAVTERLRFART